MARTFVDCPVALPVDVVYARLAAALAAEVARLDALGDDATAPRTVCIAVRPARGGCRLLIRLGRVRRVPEDRRLAATVPATDVPRLVGLLYAAVASLLAPTGADDEPLLLRPADQPVSERRNGAPTRDSEQRRLWLPRITDWVVEGRNSTEIEQAIARNYPDERAPAPRTLQEWMRQVRAEHDRATRE